MNRVKDQDNQSKNLIQLENDIGEMEESIKMVEELMNAHNTDENRLRELFEEKERIEYKLRLAYENWESL